MKKAQAPMAQAYEDNGFVVPIDILTAEEARALRDDFEAAEAELADDPEKLKLLYSYPDRLLLMVWSGALFVKEAKSPKIVSWHQDLTYWGLDDAEETTCWVAISEASVDAGCMKFVPGSHKKRIVPHTDTFDENNMLSRGQEIAVDVDEDDAVPAALKAGQASMHHGHLFHGSGPNTTNDRRIGTAIRYIKPAMKQESGAKSLVALVAGKDDFGHFEIANAPKGRLHEDDFETCRLDAARKQEILFDGVS